MGLARYLMACSLSASLCIASLACYAAERVTQLAPGDYQVFLTKWTPGSTPLCAVIQNEAQWSRVLHPAPVMSDNQRFEPAAKFWKGHAVLLLGRSVFGAKNNEHIFRLDGVTRSHGTMAFSVHFAAPQPSSYKIGWFIAVAVKKPLPAQITFVENGIVVCTLDSETDHWLSPVAH